MLIALTAVDAVCTFVCFRRGEIGLGVVGVVGLFGLAPLALWFPLYGALKRTEAVPAPSLIATDVAPVSTDPVSFSELARYTAISLFIGDARRKSVIDEADFQRLTALLDEEPIETEPMMVNPTVSLDEPVLDLPRWAPVQAQPSVPARTEPPPPAVHPPTPSPEPGELRQAWQRTWDAWSAEFAVHGFAYLGVSMTFVAVLGFLLFAFVDVPDSQQLVYELGIAVVFFAWGWFLRRQGAVHVAAGMELIGGMVLPLVLFASFVDNVPFPPDFSGRGVIAPLTITSLTLAFVYSRYTRGRPESTLRFLVAPLIWLAAMTVGFWFKTDEFITSDAIARLVSPQPALAALVLAATLGVALHHRQHRLAAPTVTAALVGMPVAYLLTISLTVATGWDRVWPLAMLGLATILVAELLASWYDKRDVLDLARPLILGLSLVTLAPAVDLGWLGLVTAGVYILAFEYGLDSSRTIKPGLVFSGAGAVVGGLLALTSPWPALLTSVGLTVWAHLRRNVEWERSSVRDGFLVLAAIAPLGIGFAALQLLSDGVSLIVLGAVLVASSALVRISRSEDEFWPVWLSGAGVVLATVAFGIWADGRAGVEASLAVAMAALCVGVAPKWPVGRLWGAGALGAGAVAMALSTVDASSLPQTLVWAVTGLVLVGAASLLRRGRAGHVAVIGHLVGSIAFVSLDGDEVGLAVAWSAWAAAWVASTVSGELEGESVRSLLDRLFARAALGSGAGWVTPIMAVATLPLAAVAVARLAGDLSDGWAGAVLSLVALSYVAAARMLSMHEPVGKVLAGAGMVVSMVGLALAVPYEWPTILGCVVVIGVAGAIPARLRQSWFNWVAWLSTVPLVLLLGDRAGLPAGALDTLVFVWGGLLMLGGLAVDDALAGRREPEQGIRTPWLVPAVVVGAAAFVVGLSVTMIDSGSAAGWWALVGALLSFAAAWSMRIATLSIVGYSLAAFGVIRIVSLPPSDDPWLLIAIAAPLVLSSWLLESRHSPSPTLWARWDLPPLVVAHVLGLFALALAFPDSVGVTWLAGGLLSVVVSVWKRNRAWAEAGNLLVLGAALDTGLGWFALALAATSLRGMIGARLSEGNRRFSYQAIAVGSAGLTWPALLAWQEVGVPTSLELTAVVFGVVSVAAAIPGVTGLLRRDTSIGWGGLGISGVTLASVAGLVRPEWVDGPWLAAGLLLVAVAIHVGAPIIDGLIRVLAVPVAGLAWLALIPGLGWSGDEAVRHSALVFGLLAVVTSQVVTMWRKGVQDLDRATKVVPRSWLGLAVIGVCMALVANREVGEDLAVAVGTALTGVGLIRSARPLELGWLRSVAMGALMVSLNLGAVIVGMDGDSLALAIVILAAAASLVSTSVWRRRPSSVWVTPLLVLAGLANLEAAAMGLAALPDRALLAAVAVSIGIQTLVVGLTRNLPAVLAVAPVAVGLGFVLGVYEGIAGSAQWYTVPFGVVLLCEVEILRLWRRQSGASVPDVQVMEWVGVGILVVPGIVEMFTGSLIYGLVPFLTSGLLLTWATVTRVRRRVVSAAAVAIATSVLVLFAAAADRTPDSASFWIIGFGTGLAVMLVAAFVEAYRSRRGVAMLRLHELMEGWE